MESLSREEYIGSFIKMFTICIYIKFWEQENYKICFLRCKMIWNKSSGVSISVSKYRGIVGNYQNSTYGYNQD